MKQKQVFLIQCNSEKADHKYSGEYSDRTYADEMNKYLYYRNDTWNTEGERDKDFEEVKPGDVIIQYCASTVKSHPSQIYNIFSVVKTEMIDEEKTKPHIIRLKLERTLKCGCGFSTIRHLVAQGRLSKKMNNCGQRGFNICKVEFEDYQAIIDWDNN